MTQHSSKPDAPLFRPGWISATAVGAYVPRVAKPAFEAYGFPGAAIVAEWPAIAGADMAAYTAPERLVWPRRRREGAEAETAGSPEQEKRSAGATLVLRVEGPRAIEVQHGAAQIIERVNAYFGYAAVTALRIVQGPVSRKSERRAPPAREPAPDEAGLERIEDEGLRAALARLGARLG